MERVLITGANRGIGLALATCYAAAGHRVIACCREPGTARKLRALARARKRVTLHAADVADPASVAALAADIGSAPIDILINNAGVRGPLPNEQCLKNMDFPAWMETFAVNTMAPLRMVQSFHHNLKAGNSPRVVTITSEMGALARNFPALYAYSSSKAALNKVMRMASVDLARDGIAVGLIHPGWVKTQMGGANAALTADESANAIKAIIDKLTLANTGSFTNWNGEDHPW